MATITVRNLSSHVLAALKARAARNNRSLQCEVKSVLEEAAAGAAVPVTSAALRALRLHTVRIGGRMRYSRDDIYGDGER